MSNPDTSLNVPSAYPYWISITLIPIAWFGALNGGLSLALLPLFAWVVFSLLDTAFGSNTRNPTIATPDSALVWHQLIVRLWPFLQLATTFGLLIYVQSTEHLMSHEKVFLFLGVGLMNGTIGIVYAHELIHRPGRTDRLLGDLLLGMVLYGHYRSEHLLVHHRYVATPRDPVTARFRENFWRFYPRVLKQSLSSAFRAEKAKLAKSERPPWHRSNPFWRYLSLAACSLGLAGAIGGASGIALILTSAGFAVFQLELVNYIEHYGLTRKHLGDGLYEAQKPHHSWNSGHVATSALLINVTRHSDHHASPGRAYPLLQLPEAKDAPYLPYGYAVMTTIALIPPVWMALMNPRVRAWRRQFYPEIVDWSSYDGGLNPMPTR